jgi:hypothetical protein
MERWEFLGKGKHYQNGRCYRKAGEMMEGDSPPPTMRDKFRCVESHEAELVRPRKDGLFMRERGGGWWDVVNPTTGNPINSAALRFDEAAAMVDAPPPEPVAPEA